MTILYINDEHCTSVEQLRSYFWGSLSYESPVFFELIDYARTGDISSWLREKGESVLADNVDRIDGSLGDRDYFSRLSGLMTGVDANQDSPVLEKPDFSKCFQVEDVRHEQTSDGIAVSVKLKVLSVVNESYEICVRTSWGTKAQVVNPFKEKVGGIFPMAFSFRKRQYVKFKDVVLLVDEKELKDVKYTGLGGEVLEFEVGSCCFKMIRVEGGTFMMGDNKHHHSARHRVTLNDYYIGETQVTQALWTSVMGSNPSRFKGGELPVESVSWNDCQDFIRKLNSFTGRKFRLPTEAEWEFAAKGGKKSCYYESYSGGDVYNEVAWFIYNSDNKTQPVKTLEANELGIYDMSGNVWEWCYDWSGDYSRSTQTNPKGPKSGDARVKRGGCFCDGLYSVTDRQCCKPHVASWSTGLRLVLSD